MLVSHLCKSKKSNTSSIILKSSMDVRLYRVVMDVYVFQGRYRRVAEARKRRPGAVQERAGAAVAGSAAVASSLWQVVLG